MHLDFVRISGRQLREGLLTLVGVAVILMLLASPAEAAKYLTNTDNENNAGTGVADGDMGGSPPPCVYNTDGTHPIEFEINVTGAVPTQNAYLAIFIADVDWPSEVDEVFLNGHSLGYATGVDELNYSTLFVIPDLSWVVAGDNLIQVYVDVNNGAWCARTYWGQLIIDEGTGEGPAFIRTATADQTSYNYGSPVTVDLEVDTTLAAQDVRLELVLRDPDGDLIAFDTNPAIQNWSITAANDEPYSWSFNLPGSGTDGIWAVSATVYDRDSGEFQAHETVTFAVPLASTPPPNVTAVSPSQGEEGTATAVVIQGSNFLAGDTTCSVGGISLSNPNIIDNNNVSGNVADTLALGFHDVTCTTSYGSSTLASGFEVISTAPGIASITPSEADFGVETSVVISGSNFIDGDTTCTIGGFPLENLSVTDPSSLTADIPATLPPGTHDVVCSTSNGSATLPAGFQVMAVVAEVPAIGPLAMSLLIALLACAGFAAARYL